MSTIRSLRSTLLHAAGAVFAALPVGFGVIRAVTTGNDLRYLWIAFASLLGIGVVMAGQRRRRPQLAPAVLSIETLCVSMVLATLVALFLGTRFGPGMLVVTFSFALCCAASTLTYMLAGDYGPR